MTIYSVHKLHHFSFSSYVFQSYQLPELVGVVALEPIKCPQNLLKQLSNVSLEKYDGQSDCSDWILPPTFFFLSSPTVLRAAILLSMSETCQRDTVSKAASPRAANVLMSKTSETCSRATWGSRTLRVILQIHSC
jgi:hypothetical protein